MKLFYKEKHGNRRVLHILGWNIKYKKKETVEAIVEAKMQNYLNTFLNCFYEPRDLTPKSGKLKFLNDGNTELIRIIHEICNKYNLKYWLAYGTLLGAIRHNGPIPWDYDGDIAMPRDDYNIFFDVVEKELKNTEVKIYGVSEILPFRGNIIILTNKTGEEYLNLDIVPIDIVSVNDSQKKELALSLINNSKSFYNKIFPIDKHITQTAEIEKYNKEINLFIDKVQLNNANKNLVIRLIPHNRDFDEYYNYEDIFPLSLVDYDGYQFYVPNNYKSVLCMNYGINWNSFPKTFDINALSFWTSKIKTDDANKILSNLKQIKIN